MIIFQKGVSILELTIENVSKNYGDKKALKDFSTTLTPGVYGLLGPNGSGKTTLMRIVVDILKPSNGRVLLNGCDIKNMGNNYRDILGYLPQNFGVYKNFTAERFLMYIAALKGLNKEQAKEKVNELLDLVNLKDVNRKKLGGFSGGMKRRIGIAQALLNDPKILVLDEPTAGLDPKERIRFRNLISKISKDKIVILSTHIVSDIEYAAKEVVLIKEGNLILKDNPNNILKTIKNQVWSVKVDENELLNLQQIYKVENITRTMDDIEIRILSNKKPLPNAKEEIPRFEDVYLYYFDDIPSENTEEGRDLI